MNMNSKQTVSREEYRSLDNRVTCILQQRWPAKEISDWGAILKGKLQSVAWAILRRWHPRPISLALPPSPQRCQSRFRPEPTEPKYQHVPLMADQ
ncbi:hypothetical protein [Aeromonas dhakensis]|uniref:hypothetical protein n=1 Tax=Aeromonas dhakensis TaxID=196024 RepID=UPI003D6B6DAD